jgi:hypothetical protein
LAREKMVGVGTGEIAASKTAVSRQLSAISYQLSVISFQLSAFSYQPSALSRQLSAFTFRLSAINGLSAQRACMFYPEGHEVTRRGTPVANCRRPNRRKKTRSISTVEADGLLSRSSARGWLGGFAADERRAERGAHQR